MRCFNLVTWKQNLCWFSKLTTKDLTLKMVLLLGCVYSNQINIYNEQRRFDLEMQVFWGESEEERGHSRRRGEKKGKVGGERQGEDRSRSWAIVTSIDPISHCLFAHSPLCIKGAVLAAGRPQALHLITWHANRCYGLIRALWPPSFCIYDYLGTKEKGWLDGEREGGWGGRRKSNTSWWPGV